MRNIRNIRNVRGVRNSSLNPNFGLDFLQVKTDIVNMSVAYTSGNDFFIETRVKWLSKGQDFVSMGSQDPFNFWFAINNTNNNWEWGVSQKLLNTGVDAGSFIGKWIIVRLEYNDSVSEGKLYADGSLIATFTGLTSKATGTQNFSIGKFKEFPVNSGDTVIDWINFNGEIFRLNKIVSGNIIGSKGTSFAITTDRADVNDMLIKI